MNFVLFEFVRFVVLVVGRSYVVCRRIIVVVEVSLGIVVLGFFVCFCYFVLRFL